VPRHLSGVEARAFAGGELGIESSGWRYVLDEPTIGCTGRDNLKLARYPVRCEPGQKMVVWNTPKDRYGAPIM